MFEYQVCTKLGLLHTESLKLNEDNEIWRPRHVSNTISPIRHTHPLINVRQCENIDFVAKQQPHSIQVVID